MDRRTVLGGLLALPLVGRLRERKPVRRVGRAVVRIPLKRLIVTKRRRIGGRFVWFGKAIETKKPVRRLLRICYDTPNGEAMAELGETLEEMV